MSERARALSLTLPIASSLALLITACAADESVADYQPVDVTQTERAGGINKVKHVVVVMLENHSFDNYLGALAYAPGTPYHSPSGAAGCTAGDHRCVDGLSCQVDAAGELRCSDANVDSDGSTVFAFHDRNRCVRPDPDHEWVG